MLDGVEDDEAERDGTGSGLVQRYEVHLNQFYTCKKQFQVLVPRAFNLVRVVCRSQH
jgi:hypothetical protein